ncbi:MAG: hypothetical protein GY795_43585 [Desulfobacterales bacterium]|nr:hypothetical protein [Desulfobacterales bacterium]
MGTSFLILICMITGQITLAAALRFNKKRIDHDNKEMVRMHNLSVYALLSKNKKAYSACNKEANEAFGKVFFSQIALGLTSLWPAPFALGWMQTRFIKVEFSLPLHLPLLGQSVGYAFTFILIYILVYIFFVNIKHRLPYFKGIDNILDSGNKESEQMISLSDL